MQYPFPGRVFFRDSHQIKTAGSPEAAITVLKTRDRAVDSTPFEHLNLRHIALRGVAAVPDGSTILVYITKKPYFEKNSVCGLGLVLPYSSASAGVT